MENRPVTASQRIGAPAAQRWRIALVALLSTVLTVLTVLIAGCGATVAGTASTVNPLATGLAAAEQQARSMAEPQGGDDVDACGLLTAAEIQQVIGQNSGPRGSGRTCTWENTDDYHSVTVDIGVTGSAVDGHLPDPMPGASTEDGPDGIRYSSGNVAEFLIGTRACQIQVVTSVTDNSDRPTMVRLIALIRQRLSA